MSRYIIPGVLWIRVEAAVHGPSIAEIWKGEGWWEAEIPCTAPHSLIVAIQAAVAGAVYEKCRQLDTAAWTVFIQPIYLSKEASADKRSVYGRFSESDVRRIQWERFERREAGTGASEN